MKSMAWLTALLAITFAVSPFIADPFGGFREDQFPIPQDRAPILPAGYAFSIWGVIYTWLVVMGLYGALKRAEDAAWNATRPYLIISLAIGTAWLFIANVSVFWATVTIWMMLATALAALYASPIQDRLWLRAPIGLFAGWLSAASFVSLAVYLAGNFYLYEEGTWALILIPAATALAALVQLTRKRTPEYGIAVTWALSAIVVKNLTELNLPGTAALAGTCAILIALLAFRSARQTA